MVGVPRRHPRPTGGVIGKSGATIKKLQAETGAKMRFNKEAGGAAANEVVVWSNSSTSPSRRESRVRAHRGSRRILPGWRPRSTESLGTRGAARKAHSSDPEDGEIHEGAVVLALGGGDDALDFTDVLSDDRGGGWAEPRECVGRRLRVWWPGRGAILRGGGRPLGRVEEVARRSVRRRRRRGRGPGPRDVGLGKGGRGPRGREGRSTSRRRRRRRRQRSRGGEDAAGPAEGASSSSPRREPRSPVSNPSPPRGLPTPTPSSSRATLCGKGPYNAKGIKLHRKMWCNKEGPFVGKKKGSETAAAPGDAKKRPRPASADRFGFVDEAGGERGEREMSGIRQNLRSRRLARALTPCERRSRTSLRPAPSSSPRFETWIPTPRPRRCERRVRPGEAHKNALDSGYACEQTDG